MENISDFLGFLFSAQQIPDFLPGSCHAWGFLVTYYWQYDRGVYVCLVPHTRGRSTYWDRAWRVGRLKREVFYSTYFILLELVFILLVKQNSPFSVACFYPTNDLLSIFMLSSIVSVQYLFLIVCLYVLNISNSPVSLQFRNSAIQAVTEILSWAISSNSLQVVFKCWGQWTVSFRVTFVRDAILHSLTKCSCILTPFPVALSPVLGQCGMH